MNTVRPTWDQHFMLGAFRCSLRSPSAKLKVGAVLVDNSTKFEIGSGYNGYPPGAAHKSITRLGSDGRKHEVNCITNCHMSPSSIDTTFCSYLLDMSLQTLSECFWGQSWNSVSGHVMNILICGDMGSGKTTYAKHETVEEITCWITDQSTESDIVTACHAVESGDLNTLVIDGFQFKQHMQLISVALTHSVRLICTINQLKNFPKKRCVTFLVRSAIRK